MKGTNLGEFEELLMLVVAALYPQAYGLAIREAIKDKAGRSVAMGAVHAALNRLEKKGYLSSQLDEATHARGGRRKRLFALTVSGKATLIQARDLRTQLWGSIDQLSWDQMNFGYGRT
ncbi:MAG: PadR family transcriptional regulator [Bacteroidota bacterium]